MALPGRRIEALQKLLIVLGQHLCPLVFDNHQLALVEGVRAIEIGQILRHAKLKMYLPPVRLLLRGLLKNAPVWLVQICCAEAW